MVERGREVELFSTKTNTPELKRNNIVNRNKGGEGVNSVTWRDLKRTIKYTFPSN